MRVRMNSMTRIVMLLVLLSIIMSCDLGTFNPNPLVGTWTWNDASWTFNEDMTYSGPTAGTYSFVITKQVGPNGAGTSGTLSIEASTYNFLIQSYDYMDLYHFGPAVGYPPVAPRIGDGLMERQ